MDEVRPVRRRTINRGGVKKEGRNRFRG